MIMGGEYKKKTCTNKIPHFFSSLYKNKQFESNILYIYYMWHIIEYVYTVLD